MMSVRRAFRWCSIVLCLVGVGMGLHFYGEHCLEQARARLARAGSLPALPVACGLPESDSRNAAFWYQSAGSAYLATRASRETLDLRPLVDRSPITWSAKDLEQAASDLANPRAAAACGELGLWSVPPPFEWTLPPPARTPR
jgi:hypothetical protein